MSKNREFYKKIENIEKITGCINRDRSATTNMKNIVSEMIRTRKRPEIFSRQKSPKP